MKPFNYKPTTPHDQQQAQTNMYNNFQQAFTPNETVVHPTDFRNRGQVMHNNLGDKLLNERILERHVVINSSDRDRNVNPDKDSPFKIKVSFGNCNTKPMIDENLTNIKYVTLNSVIVPKTIAIDTSQIDIPGNVLDILPTSSSITGFPPTNAPPASPYHNLETRPHLILKVDELNSKDSMGSSALYQNDKFILTLEQRTGDAFIYKPKYSRSTVVYQNSLLKNLSKFTLTLLDNKGKEFNILDHTGKDIIKNKINPPSVPYNYNEYVEKYKDENQNVEHTDCITQVIYDFTFGIIDNELNTLTNYNSI